MVGLDEAKSHVVDRDDCSCLSQSHEDFLCLRPERQG
jgi:hypothetical protein